MTRFYVSEYVDVEVELSLDEILEEMSDDEIDQLAKKALENFQMSLTDFAKQAREVYDYYGEEWLSRWMRAEGLELRECK